MLTRMTHCNPTQHVKAIRERLQKNVNRKLILMKRHELIVSVVHDVTRKAVDVLEKTEEYVVKETREDSRKKLAELEEEIIKDKLLLVELKAVLPHEPPECGLDRNGLLGTCRNVLNTIVNTVNEQMKKMQIGMFGQGRSDNKLFDKNITRTRGILKKDENWNTNLVSSPKKRVRHKPILTDRIPVHYGEDHRDPMIVSFKVVKLHGRKLILMSDVHNCCIKCGYIKKAVEHDESDQDYNPNHQNLPSDKSILHLPGRPGGLAQTCSDVMVVVITDKKLITFFGLQPHLLVDRHIKTAKEYGGISFFNDVLVAAAPWSEPSSVDVLDLKGNILKSFSLCDSEGPYVDVPWFVSMTPQGHAVVSDTYEKNVVCLSLDGETVYSFEAEYSATVLRDTAVDDRGDIYICDSERCEVLMFSPKGQYQGYLLTKEDGLEKPWLITFDEDRHLYIKEAGKDIKVFQ